MIFYKVYKKDVERLLNIDELWKTRAKPRPLDPKLYKEIQALKEIQDAIAWDQNCWSIEDNVSVFKSRFVLSTVMTT
jgi:ubiquitin-like 1-activating enzyme E1 B